MDEAAPPIDEGLEDLTTEITQTHQEDREILWTNYVAARKQEFIAS